MTEITFDEFKKAEIKIGTILSAEKVPDADKLIKLIINLGLNPSVPSTEGSPDHSSATNGLGEEQDIRQILSGIAMHYEDPSVLVGKQVPVLANLPTRTIRGLESQGMVLYAVGLNPVPQGRPTAEGGLGEGFIVT